MQSRIPLPRALPLTIVGLSALLVFKSVTFVHAAGAALLAATPEKASAVPVAASPPAVATNDGQIAPKLDALLAPSPTQPSPQPATSTAPTPNALDELARQQNHPDADQRDIDARAELLKSANAKLAAQLATMEQQRQALQQAEASRNASDSSAWTDLARMYEDMAPKNAASIFNVIDVHVLLHIVEHMNVRKASSILAAMDPDRAKLVTQMLAQQKTASLPHVTAVVADAPANGQPPEAQGK